MEPCEIHEMLWCALCNGDAKKFERDTQPSIYDRFLVDDDAPKFLGLQEKSK